MKFLPSLKAGGIIMVSEGEGGKVMKKCI